MTAPVGCVVELNLDQRRGLLGLCGFVVLGVATGHGKDKTERKTQAVVFGVLSHHDSVPCWQVFEARPKRLLETTPA